MKTFNPILLIIITTTLTFAAVDQTSQIFSEANAAFDNHEFDKAVSLYQTLIASGVNDATVFYNLGNAEYRRNNIGFARLYYERSLDLKPGEADADYNIAFIEEKFLNPSLRESNFTDLDIILKSLVRNFPAPLAIPVLVIAFVLLNVFLGVLQFNKDILPSSLNWIIILSLSLVIVISLAFASTDLLISSTNSYAIITGKNVEVFSEPSSSAPSNFPAPEAMKVKISRQQSDWVEIILPNGSKGWIPQNLMEII